MFSMHLVDPSPNYPEYDCQIWSFLTWTGTAMPLGRNYGEWIYVGKINKIKNKK